MHQQRKKEKSIFQSIFKAMLIVLIIELFLLVATLYFGNVGKQLNQNAVDILKKQVENRQNYLETTMVENQNLSSISGILNNAVESRIASGLDIEKLDSDEKACASLMEETSDSLINVLRHRSVNGIFVIFNTHDLDERETDSVLQGIYIRDLDPMTAASERNHDLLLERSPVQIVKSLEISTDRGWTPGIKFKNNKTEGILYPVFQAAYKDGGQLNAADYGRWTSTPYTLPGDDRSVVAYSVPLILDDGTVYGVIGVEMLTTYLETMLPYTELQNNSTGTYLLAETGEEPDSDTLNVKSVDVSSKEGTLKSTVGEDLTLNRLSKNIYEMKTDKKKYMVSAYPLELYNKNAPFSKEQWMLIGAVEEKNLYAFGNQVFAMLKLTILITLLVGVVCSYIISRRLASPIAKLSEEVAEAQGSRNTIPKLSSTGIRELDQFSDAITQLSQDVLNTSTKFLRIMEMASVEIGGYEIRFDTGSVFFTENFFTVIGAPFSADAVLNLDEFRKILRDFTENYFFKSESGDTNIYCVRLPKRGLRYVRMEVKMEGWVQVGLVEDVTTAMMERLRIEHERDYDALTGLHNRRAFKRESEKIFSHPDKIGHAALVMMDLDNLKYINDTFGHDYGDQYIRAAANALRIGSPENAVISRMSGDEFYLFLYGYDSEDQARERIDRLQKSIQTSTLELPNRPSFRIRASAGVAWYPKDSESYEQLIRYADFAMYSVKNMTKGRFAEFNITDYEKSAYLLHNSEELNRLIEEELLDYYFQPIVNARTGQVFGYEALMRPRLTSLETPLEVLSLAKSQGKLYQIERLTWFLALKSFTGFKNIPPDCRLFINSIANQGLSESDEKALEAQYGPYLGSLVVELTEEEERVESYTRKKISFLKRHGGQVALDDFGAGYNGEVSLLAVRPDFIKVDLSIVRNCHQDKNRQEMISNIISFARKNNSLVIAEGVQSREEMDTVISLGVDYLQGYYVGVPSLTSQPIPDKILKEITSRSR